jgi:hypothetical protein
MQPERDFSQISFLLHAVAPRSDPRLINPTQRGNFKIRCLALIDFPAYDRQNDPPQRVRHACAQVIDHKPLYCRNLGMLAAGGPAFSPSCVSFKTSLR